MEEITFSGQRVAFGYCYTCTVTIYSTCTVLMYSVTMLNIPFTLYIYTCASIIIFGSTCTVNLFHSCPYQVHWQSDVTEWTPTRGNDSHGECCS